MNRDDILRMARESGATKVDAADPQCWIGAIAFETDELVRFAALVAAVEREACAALLEAEREAIIQMMPGGHSVDPQWVCDAIRARTP